MKARRGLGLFLMAFAVVLALGLGIRMDAKAYASKGTKFYNKDGNNGEAGLEVQYKVTKQATGSSRDKKGECIAIGCHSDSTEILICAYPNDGKAYYKCTGIEKGAFSGKTKLKKATINSNTTFTSIPTEAFKGCTKLTSVTIENDDIKSIGSKAFYGCKKLSSFKILSKKVTKSRIGSKAFSGVSSVKIKSKSKSYSKKFATWAKAKGAKVATY